MRSPSPVPLPWLSAAAVVAAVLLVGCADPTRGPGSSSAWWNHGQPVGLKIQAETWDPQGTTPGAVFNEKGGEGESVAGFQLNEVLMYRGVPLKSSTQMAFNAAAPYAGSEVEVWADAVGPGGTRLGIFRLATATKGWDDFAPVIFDIVGLSGTHDLFVVPVKSGGDWLFKLDWFQLGPPPAAAGDGQEPHPPPSTTSDGGSTTSDGGPSTPPTDPPFEEADDGGVPDDSNLGLGSLSPTLPVAGGVPAMYGNAPVAPKVTSRVKAPIPTNDWWSSLVFQRFPEQPYSQPMFPHPLALQAEGGGLGISLPAKPTIYGDPRKIGEYHFRYEKDFLLGVEGMNAPRTEVDGFGDWTVTASWTDGPRSLLATFGHGLPFVYAQSKGGAAVLSFTAPPTVFFQEGNVVGVSVNGHAYGVYAPAGSQWALQGNVLRSDLAGKDYWSVAGLPSGSPDIVKAYGKSAFAFVTGSRVSYVYDSAKGVVRTAFDLTTQAREGAETGAVIALYPTHWKRSATPLTSYQYPSPRGTMKVVAGNRFVTELPLGGVLPALPDVGVPDPARLKALVQELKNEPSHSVGTDGTGTYWTGKSLGRIAAAVRIAEQVGDTAARDSFLGYLKTTLQDWFTAQPGKVARVFYYEPTWGTLIGYPAEYGSDKELNDHHFHYGYYVMAAATVAQYDPAWAQQEKWGAMVNQLVRDAANPYRDSRYPFLRNFDPFAGHGWAAGHAAFANGNNQESSSESMNFSAAVLLWGAATGNPKLRDLGAYLYATEANTIEQAWFDVDGDVFPDGFEHSTAGMVWGSGGAYATWFTAIPSQIHGINLLPITAGSLYLGRRAEHAVKNYDEMLANNGAEGSMIWAGINWSSLALGDAPRAATLLTANPGYTVEEGESRAFTYHWIHSLAALGQVDAAVTANSPTAVAFTKAGTRTYVAFNPLSQPVTVRFSTGATLTVPPGQLVSGR